MWKQTFSSRCFASALGLCLAVAGSPALGAEHAFDGDYSGKRVLTKGSANSRCPAEDDVSVSIHGETLTFTNSVQKKITQPFDPGPDGSFGQTYTDEGGTTVHYQALLNFEWVTRCPPRRWARAHGLELQPIGPPVAIVAGDAWPL